MLKIDLVAVGTRPPPWVVQGIEQYSLRMKRDCRFQILEIKTSDRKKKQSVAIHQEEEAKLIGSHFNAGARVIAMDSRGKIWSTEQLAGKVGAWSQQTNHFQFVIGGPDGLSDVIINRADEIWSLSNLTFPHFLVRVLLAEQIYRALMLNANHPYHK
ncbi:MAG: 23S rRNA (pseudouridine(1915)-N(3))-methyltransferase RlmH [Gammaproteobacteria bacterium]|nr:23S rRNA (pseudouridine(1915)-N(3))-methyltransferase RlmH [Gammaproteobacteria bacterium]MBT3870515.1 23S rRNA (pseudouridine(1915)-N(3))-methyltransferase RlmH [Gammaproteobacteria bacterium]MBT4378259.1 23S rRNA (pseudouridine(1915)-N(3))-methyltransferase RlmH [Gammaproteobacteria bacterium]MBT4615480.1 23S rRNA (pseudouridine(1915)-N(3))-methyltransferase RlmH [Gammaproteobacteria bacterium]MBT5198330.1 23S rRNA (pseudouridine(1915)-N(3))-methyltransferase RlmH [Gammaproteobacteria bact